MNIPDFLIAAAELERVAAKLYDALADISPDASITSSLRTLSNDEISHANAISMGRKYHEEMPDVFSRINVRDEEIQRSIEEGNGFHSSIAPGYDLKEGLKKMIELEGHFERIHLGMSIEITDPSLKRLFEALTRGDKAHISTLKKLIKFQETKDGD